MRAVEPYKRTRVPESAPQCGGIKLIDSENSGEDSRRFTKPPLDHTATLTYDGT